jgi:hypothetical protein
MNKHFLFLLLVPSICAQIDFTNSFPKIGFGDFYMMRNEGSVEGVPPHHWADNDYYYANQADLGYNYLWGSANDISLTHARNLKILHNLSGEPDKTIYFCCWSGVNDPDWLPYQVGGDLAYISNNLTDRFGFGNENQTSWWAADTYTFKMTGNRNYLDSAFGKVRTFYANKALDPPGVLLMVK